MIPINKFELAPAGKHASIIQSVEFKGDKLKVDFSYEDPTNLDTKHIFAWVFPTVSDKFPVFKNLLELIDIDPKVMKEFDENALVGLECEIEVAHNAGKDRDGNEQMYANVMAVRKKG